MKHRFVYEAIVEPDVGGLYVHFPDLADAFTDGNDWKEAVLNAAEVLELTLADFMVEGQEPPAATFGHNAPQGGAVAIVTVDVTDEDVRRMGAVSSVEAAKMLGISKGRVAQLSASGQLESYGHGPAKLISLRSINERLAAPRHAGRPSRNKLVEV
jgi:predicted RNase H-like HicB family nuclease